MRTLDACLVGSPDPRLTSARALLDLWEPEPTELDAFATLVDDGGPWGVVAPRVLEPGVGGLLVVGVVPGARGQGRGNTAVAAGWSTLASTGCTRAREEIRTSHSAIRTIFARAGLQETSRFWVARAD
ncbi:MAG: hypothetical protein KC656_28760 [Myxococcales bacterium]|nr:hypothetical protein [Myxococcales bacterium]